MMDDNLQVKGDQNDANAWTFSQQHALCGQRCGHFYWQSYESASNSSFPSNTTNASSRHIRTAREHSRLGTKPYNLALKA